MSRVCGGDMQILLLPVYHTMLSSCTITCLLAVALLPHFLLLPMTPFFSIASVSPALLSATYLTTMVGMGEEYLW